MTVHHHRRRAGAVLIAALAALVLAACSSGGTPAPSGSGIVQIGSSASSTGFAGTVLQDPVTLSAASSSASFTSDEGGSTTLAALQKKGLMLVYFGYTHCPDVCPTTMADLGQALQNSPAPVQARTQVVFVTSDPDRDTPAVMKKWLGNFDAGLSSPFVGLTSSIKQIDTVAESVGIPLEAPVVEKDGSVTVQHGAQVLAFMNGKASVVWLAGTTSDAYTRDITKLLQDGEPT